MLRYKEIKNSLEDEIEKMYADDKLPSRSALCRMLDTTRATLDKAINELVSDHRLYVKDGGIYVTGTNREISPQISNWGVIVPDVIEAVYSGIVRGVENVSQVYGANIILCNSDSDFKKQSQYIERLIHSGVSGFIIVPVVSNDVKENYDLYSQLTDSEVPFVFCNRSVEGISVPVVTSNDFYGGYIATKHLLKMGYSNIAYIARRKYKTSVDRCQGYISALIESNIEVNRKIIFFEEKHQVEPDGFESMKSILESGEKVDAVFCFNDKVTRGVYKAITEAGLRVSDDIGVIGYDNSGICEKASPALTSLAYKNVEIGEQAAHLLWKQIHKKAAPSFEFYLFQPSIVVRSSCSGKKSGSTSHSDTK